MALTKDRQMTILVIGILLIWIILWLFISRMANTSRRWSSDSLVFSTQSVYDGFSAPTKRRQEIHCPWNREIGRWDIVLFTNPLLDKSHDILGIKQGMVTENYMMYGPVWADNELWKATFISQEIDLVSASIQWNQWICTYQSEGKDLFILRQDLLVSDCYVVNNLDLVGFSCEE